MSKSRVFALIGNILYTLVALFGMLGLWILVVVEHSQAVTEAVHAEGLDMQTLIEALMMAYGFIILILVFNWLAFARLDKGRGWRIYLLVIGIFYGLSSLVNGMGMVITLPIAICFVLAYVFKRHELSENQ